MKLIATNIPDVVIIEPRVFGDERGWFMESFNEKNFHAAMKAQGLPVPPAFVQDNHSCSRKGVLRGLHYQFAPHAQGKLARVVSGATWDVAVDIRRDSPTFGQWVGAELSADNKRMMWIPAGFAHGFIALKMIRTSFTKPRIIMPRRVRGRFVGMMQIWRLSGRRWSLSSMKKTEPPTLLQHTEITTCKADNNMQVKMIPLQIHGDERGSFIALEQDKNIPFAVKRVYCLFDTKEDVRRGFHAHKALMQLVIATRGSCRFLLDDSREKVDLLLDKSHERVTF